MLKNVSVIIPTYNRSYCLERAVLSVINQSFICDELIIIDDGSTDDTRCLIDDLDKRFPSRITYYYQPNRGVAAARNYGITKSSSPLLAFLDSDDHWHKTKLAKQVKLMVEHPEYFVSHTREKWLRRGRHLNQKKIHLPRSGDIFDHCLTLCAVGMSTAMVRRELFDQVGYFNESFHCCEDYEFWLRVSGQYQFLLIDEPLTVKEGGRSDQLSNKYRIGMDKLRIQAIETILHLPNLSEKKRAAALKQLKKKCEIYSRGCMKYNKIEEGQYYQQLANNTVIPDNQD